MLLLGSYRISWDCTLDLSSQCVKMSRFNDNSVLVMIITILFKTFQDTISVSLVKRVKSGVADERERIHRFRMPFGKPSTCTMRPNLRTYEYRQSRRALCNRFSSKKQMLLRPHSRMPNTYICNELVPKARILRCNQDIAQGPERRICTMLSGHILELQFLVLPAHVAGAHLQDLPIKRECKPHIGFAVKWTLAATLQGEKWQSCLVNSVHIIFRIPYSECNTLCLKGDGESTSKTCTCETCSPLNHTTPLPEDCSFYECSCSTMAGSDRDLLVTGKLLIYGETELAASVAS